MKLMLLDGNSLINRAFYGIRMLNAPDGRPTNAVYGFLAILQRLLDEEAPDGLAVTFDVHAPTFRHLQYAEYKAGRRPMPEELSEQIPMLKELLDAMQIPRVELAGWEADDLLGTLSLRAADEGTEVVIVTGDKDALQLVDERVRVLNVRTRMGQTETLDYTPARFREEYGFDAPGMVDLKALMGDSSDNLPGVPGVGEKTALELMRRFGSLRGVYENVESDAIKPAVRKKLLAGRESAEMSYALATIRRDAPVAFSFAPWTLPQSGELYRMLRALGFTRFIDKWGLHEPKDEADSAPVYEGTCESVRPANEAELLAVLERCAGKTLFLWWEGSLDELCFHCDLSETDGLGCLLSHGSYADGYDAALARIFDPAVPKAGHDVKNLLRAAKEWGIEAGGFVFDSALAAYLLDATAGSYDIERLTQKYCGFVPFTAASGEAQMSLLEENTASEAEHSAELLSRAASVSALAEALRPLLREQGSEQLLDEIELPLCEVLADMELCGFLVDREALRRFGESLSEGIAEVRSRIFAAAGREFNIKSPKQLGTVLFEELGIPGGKKTKTGWSTNADVLEGLRYTYPIVQDVLDYRELTKLKSTYCDGLLKVIAPDGRIHTSFKMTVTATGRLSSTEPNLQNIPIRRETGALLRRMFVSGEGSVLIDADYSQIELRLLAHIADDQAMQRTFLSGEDIHRATAAQVFSVPIGEVTPELRRRAKAVNFGIVYGIGAFSLAQDIGVSVAEAKSYIEAYLREYAGVAAYQKNIVEQGKAQGYVETLFHRRRALPELRAPQFNTRAFGERVALNMPIQGTAADVIKLAMVNVSRRFRREGLRARLILQVHDELIVECPESECETAAALLREEMENAVHYAVPLTAETGIGRSWAEAH